MSEEVKKILDMVKKKQISTEEGAALISAINSQNKQEAQKPKHKGTMLRIKIESKEGDSNKAKVNINLPLSLARRASGLTRLIPKKAQEELGDSGINISDIDLAEMIDMFESGEIDGDLVNIDTSEEDSDERATVRIYVD